MEYTKGEWKAEYYNHENDEGYFILAQEDEHTQGLIADCPPHTDSPHIGKANAQLISAAPELYEALKTILRNNELGEYESQKQGLPRLIEVRDMARQALAKVDNPSAL